MSHLLVSSFTEFPLSTANVKRSRVTLHPDGRRLAQLAYFNHEENMCEAMKTIFQDSTFDFQSPKLIIVLEGGLNNTCERMNDFNEKQFSASVARLLLDLGRNILCCDKNALWLFSHVRHDSIAERINQITKQQYLANNIPLSRFVDIGVDVCKSLPVEDAPHDYKSIVESLLNIKTEQLTNICTNSPRILNKRLSRIILYGKNEDDLNDRCTILQRCIKEISRTRDNDQSEISTPRIMLLYGGDIHHVKSIYKLMNVENDQEKFGLVILRGSGGLADVLAWICDKIRNGGNCLRCVELKILTSTFVRELKVLVSQSLGCGIDDDLITLVKYLSLTRCKKVRVCDEDDDLSLYFLEALVTNNQKQHLALLKLYLSLAFDLNQPKFASRMLRTNQNIPEEYLIKLAKMAIIRDQIEFLQILEDVSGITLDSFGEDFHYELSVKMNYNHALFVECIQHNFGCNLNTIYRPTGEYCENTDDEIQSINVKLFLWAVFFDHYTLSLHLWRQLNDRLCGALIAALIYRYTADLSVKRSSTESVTIQKLKDHADEYENLAIRLLQSIYTTNSDMSKFAIQRQNFEFNNLSSLDVAILSHSENFIGHTSVQQVFDATWCGEKNDETHETYLNKIHVGRASSFGHATNGILAKHQQIKFLLTIRNKLSHPKVKYSVHFLFYVAFLNLLSYIVLFVKTPLFDINEEIYYLNANATCLNNQTLCSRTKFYKQSWSVSQTILNIWVLMYALEEFRHMKSLKTKDIGIIKAFILYLGEPWNKLDSLCIFTYVASILLESYNTNFTLNAARALLSIHVALAFIRLLVLLMIDRTVGPMLLMIQAMLNDMMTFFSIFFVFTSAYGVASFSLLKKGKLSLDMTVFRKIFHQAYWHLFGQISDLDDIQDNFDLTGWTAFTLLALYMAISNILLVNLLVAMFSNTFDRMHENMDILWKFHRYYTIKEYTALSTFPPPFNLFGATNYDLKPFNPKLSVNQLINLRRREALAYESDVLEQAEKDNQSDINHKEKLDLQFRQLRKMVTHVKVTCEASTLDTETF